eukprot:g1087.t1
MFNRDLPTATLSFLPAAGCCVGTLTVLELRDLSRKIFPLFFISFVLPPCAAEKAHGHEQCVAADREDQLKYCDVVRHPNAGNTSSNTSTSAISGSRPESCHCPHAHVIDDHAGAFPFLLFMLFAGVAVRSLLALLPSTCWQPPYTVIMSVVGLVMSVVNRNTDLRCTEFGRSIRTWEQVHPDIIMFVFLPPLLFEDAFGTDFYVFRKIAKSALLLALPGVVMAIGLTAGLVYLIFPVIGADRYAAYVGWQECFLMGSILSATDPVAVVAVLHT